MKKIIIISYFFNPANFVGGERTYAWAKYLSKFGIYPIIVTRQWNKGQKDIVDKIELKKTIHDKYDGYEVYRLPYKNSFRDKLATSNKLRLIQKFLTFKEVLLANFFIEALPYSNFYSFVKELVGADDSIKAVIASGRPFQSFFIGHKLKMKYPHLIWIADYRDEWSSHQNKGSNSFLSKIVDFLEQKSELKWTKNIDFFIGVSATWVESISNLIHKKGVEIKNGYWELAPITRDLSLSKEYLTITYAGSVYSSQNFSIFIDAIKHLIENNAIKIHVNFIGTNTNVKENEVLKTTTKGFEDCFVFKDRVSKEELLLIYKKTDLLFLTGYDNVKGWYPVKLFDYYSTEIPMLLCPSDNDVMQQFVKETDSGYVVNTKSDCIKLLLELYTKKINEELLLKPYHKKEAFKYSRLYQTELLSKKLKTYFASYSTHKNCLVCNSKKIKLLNDYSRAYLAQCQNCDFVFSHKKPTEKELTEHYNQYTRDDYLSPLTIKRYHELLDEMEKYRTTNNLLDVGCGVGYFLEEAKKRGWNVYGTEFTDEAITICKQKGILMNQGVLDATWYEDDFFDVITSFEVIEHINNPVVELSNTRKILRKDGLYYCTTPNFNSISRRYLKQKWNNILYPEHLSYYTKSTLSNTLKESGLYSIKAKTTGVSFLRIKTSKKGEEIGRATSPDSVDELLRNKFEKNILYSFIKKSLNGVLSLFSLGDTIKIYAIKK